jgi:hypothetical protein
MASLPQTIKSFRAQAQLHSQPRPAVRRPEKPGTGPPCRISTLVDEDTDWSSVCNLTGLRYAYRTFYDPKPYVIDLGKTDFTGEPRIGKLPAKGEFEPATV